MYLDMHEGKFRYGYINIYPQHLTLVLNANVGHSQQGIQILFLKVINAVNLINLCAKITSVVSVTEKGKPNQHRSEDKPSFSCLS